jgi:hypothetical protein
MSLKLDLCAIILFGSLQPAAEAHDIYSHLTDSRGLKCCDDHDCRPALYRVTAAGIDMFVYGRWVAVPDDKIQYRSLPGDTGETGGGHWCGLAYQQRNGRLVHITQCAILPPSTTELSRRSFDPDENGEQPDP